jgi:molybdopterin-guanine dinucleotide biosynthesis protein A
MGQDKALLPIQGVPLLQVVCSIALSCADTVYVVTPWPERYQELLPTTCWFIREVPLHHGPLVGFAQGLAQVQTDWVLLLACDLPRLRVEVLQDWAVGLNSVGQEAIALLPRHAKGWEPLCGFYRRSCLPALTDFINQGGRSFQQWLAQHSVQLLSLPEDDQMLFNCNTPADLEAINYRLDEI